MLLTEYDEKLHMRTLYEQGKEEGREEGREEGYDTANERINKLIVMLVKDGRTDDLVKSAKDSAYQKQLFEEYNL